MKLVASKSKIRKVLGVSPVGGALPVNTLRIYASAASFHGDSFTYGDWFVASDIPPEFGQGNTTRNAVIWLADRDSSRYSGFVLEHTNTGAWYIFETDESGIGVFLLTVIPPQRRGQYLHGVSNDKKAIAAFP